MEDMEQQTDDLKQIGGYGSDDGQFIWPVQLIANGDDDLYVSDEATHRITRFGQDGAFRGNGAPRGRAQAS